MQQYLIPPLVIMFLRLLVFHYITCLAAQSYIRLVREKAFPDDDFLLPRNTFECPRLGRGYNPLCRKYNGNNLKGCWCECGRQTGPFTFFEQSYACLKLSIARQRAGMSFL